MAIPEVPAEPIKVHGIERTPDLSNFQAEGLDLKVAEQQINWDKVKKAAVIGAVVVVAGLVAYIVGDFPTETSNP